MILGWFFPDQSRLIMPTWDNITNNHQIDAAILVVDQGITEALMIADGNHITYENNILNLGSW